MSKVFISHAVKDKALVEEFQELLESGIRIFPDDVFCSSLPGMGIPNGKTFVEYIKSQVTSPSVVILLISPDFLKSEFCQHEVGASWGKDLRVFPILIPPCTYNDLAGVLHGVQASPINVKETLNDLRDDLTKELGLHALGTNHWERKRDRFLAKLEDLLPITSAKHKSPLPIAKDGPTTLCMIGDGYFRTKRVVQPDKQRIIVEVIAESPQQQAKLKKLMPQYGRGPTVKYAYQNDGGLLDVIAVKSVSEAGDNLYTVELTFPQNSRSSGQMEMAYNQHSPDDIARMRAGRLLINDPPQPKSRNRGFDSGGLPEFAIAGIDSPIPVEGSVVAKTFAMHRHSPNLALEYARLEAVFALLATNTVETIEELSISLTDSSLLTVTFVGIRPNRNTNEPAERIELTGTITVA